MLGKLCLGKVQDTHTGQLTTAIHILLDPAVLDEHIGVTAHDTGKLHRREDE